MGYCKKQAEKLLEEIDEYLFGFGNVAYIKGYESLDGDGSVDVSPGTIKMAIANDSVFGKEVKAELVELIQDFLQDFVAPPSYELTPFEYELLKHFQDEGYELVGKLDGELWFGCEYADNELETQEVSGVYNILKFIDDDYLKIERILDCSEICSSPINK